MSLGFATMNDSNRPAQQADLRLCFHIWQKKKKKNSHDVAQLLLSFVLFICGSHD